MGLVFVTNSSALGPEEVEGRQPVARIAFGGTYFFLYPAIQRLREETGQLIDPQRNAFFSGSALDQLQAFLVAAQASSASQPEAWEQRVGVRGANNDVIRQTTTRHQVLQLLNDLIAAVQSARDRQMGVLFWGE